jgi:hypothetical protein
MTIEQPVYVIRNYGGELLATKFAKTLIPDVRHCLLCEIWG